MKTYTDFKDPAFAWLVNLSNSISTPCIAIRVQKHLVAVIPEDEATERDIQHGTKEDWYISVFPTLIPRGVMEAEIGLESTFMDQVEIDIAGMYRTSRIFVDSKANHYKASTILAEAQKQMMGEDTTPKAPPLHKAPGNQYSIEDQVKMSTHRSDEIDGNNPLPLTDEFKRAYDNNHDRTAKLDLTDHNSPDFQKWLNEQRSPKQ